MFTRVVFNFTVKAVEIYWRIVIILKVLRLIFLCVTYLLSSIYQVKFVHSVLIFVVVNCFPCSQNLHRGIVTLKVRRNSPGAPSLSAFTSPRSSPGSSRRNSKDVTAESSSSSNSSSPTMFRKLRQKRSQKEKRTEIVLYKGEIL